MSNKHPGRLWLAADWHLWHERMVELCYRPKDFSLRIIENIVEVVEPGDTFLNLGDISIGSRGMKEAIGTLEFLREKQVRTVLVRGNHDSQSQHWYLNHGWTWACDGLLMEYGGQKIWFSHEPVVSNACPECSGMPRDIYLNIHGHLHNSLHRGSALNDGRHILIASEHLDYRPILLDKVLQIGRTPAYRHGRFEALVP